MTQPILRVGVVGVGHLGSRHAEIYAAMPGVRLEAVCDIDAARARTAAKKLGCRALTDARGLAGLVDAASQPGSQAGIGMALFVTMRSASGKMAPSWAPPSTLETAMHPTAAPKTARCGLR